MRLTLLQRLTYMVFAAALSLTAVAIAAIVYLDEPLLLITVTGLSVLFNVWCLYRNERGGFVPLVEMRRAFEPPRQFNVGQSILLMLLIPVQLVGLLVALPVA